MKHVGLVLSRRVAFQASLKAANWNSSYVEVVPPARSNRVTAHLLFRLPCATAQLRTIDKSEIVVVAACEGATTDHRRRRLEPARTNDSLQPLSSFFVQITSNLEEKPTIE